MSQSQSTSTPSRCRVANSRISKEQLSPKPQVTAANNKTRPKSVPSPDLSNNNSKDCSSKVRRSQLLSPNKSKSGEQEVAGSQVAYPSVNRPLIVEQFSKPRRQLHAPLHSSTWKSIRRNQEESNNKEDLLEKPQSNHALIQDLQSQVFALKAELDKAHALNFQLDSLNKKLLQDLAALQTTTQSSNQQSLTGECQNPKFKDIQKLIANKLQHSTVNTEVINGPKNTFQAHQPPSAPQLLPKTGVVERQVTVNCSLPPPPPPPPPLRPRAKTFSSPAAPAVVELYHSLRNQEEGRDTARLGTQYKPPAMTMHSSIVGEIQNRSAHLLAIKEDIKKKGDFINGLIHKVLAAAYTDIEDVLKFTDWLDTELSTLADERAVLKHFKWPERKADAIREAAIEYRGLKLVENEISSYEDDKNIPCGTALKKMVLLLDK
ncbi:hypothetical protein K2173_022525 [Erythroxylum novogranatense]|uniref:Protein CHUP1, chloroplastic n=1 Tax=Erythroxylum novogranatense TaxID=1862640 RepID=A0AAV8THU6_9ROSI|nr:hypothetical protein K2173_022525 [Erythroxylum novogranatense]